LPLSSSNSPGPRLDTQPQAGDRHAIAEDRFTACGRGRLVFPPSPLDQDFPASSSDHRRLPEATARMMQRAGL
jgi:hypothetical protein